jgi:hypothetical protein
MRATDSSNRRPDEFELHQIRVQGHLDKRWSDWLEGLTVTHQRAANDVRVTLQIDERERLRAQVAVAEDVLLVAANRGERTSVEGELEAARRLAEGTGPVCRAFFSHRCPSHRTPRLY